LEKASAEANDDEHVNERVDVCAKEWEPESARDAPKQGQESEPKQVEESEGGRASEVQRAYEPEQGWAQEPLSERERDAQEEAQWIERD